MKVAVLTAALAGYVICGPVVAATTSWIITANVEEAAFRLEPVDFPTAYEEEVLELEDDEDAPSFFDVVDLEDPALENADRFDEEFEMAFADWGYMVVTQDLDAAEGTEYIRTEACIGAFLIFCDRSYFDQTVVDGELEDSARMSDDEFYFALNRDFQSGSFTPDSILWLGSTDGFWTNDFGDWFADDFSLRMSLTDTKIIRLGGDPISPIPLPASAGFLLAGFAGLGLFRRMTRVALPS